MADPRTELADIVVPAAPEIVATSGNPLLWAAVAMACVAGIALAAWLWQRRRPVRALRQVASAVHRQQDTVPALAARLDAWARMRYQQPRMDAAQCPSGIDSAAWSGWVKALEQLRFAPTQPDGYAALAALCETARAWERHV
jgi:uncharacterized protein HemX